MQDTLAALQTRGDQFTRNLINERQHASQLEDKLKEVNDAIASERESNKTKAIALLNKHTITSKVAYSRADGLNPTRTALMNQRRLLKNMEGRLNKALVRGNKIDTENNLVRGKIDMLRRKTCNDNMNRACMEKELKTIQERMDQIMRRAAAASDQTEKIEKQRNQVLSEDMVEEQRFQEDMQRMNEYISEQSRLLEESIANVANDAVRSVPSSHTKKVEHGTTVATALNRENNDGEPIINDIRQLQEKLERLNSEHESSTENLRKSEAKMQHYKEHLKLIKEASGMDSIENIINAFTQNEEECFSLFSYIQAINKETDDVMEETRRVEMELEENTENQNQRERQRAAVVSTYKDVLKDAEEKRQKMNEIATEGRETVRKIAGKVQGLYLTLRCRLLETQPQNLVGGGGNQSKEEKRNQTRKPLLDRKLTMCTGEAISEGNIIRHMELIERRTMQIIGVYAKILASDSKAHRRPSITLVRSSPRL